MESIRIKKMGQTNSIFECQLGGRGGGVRLSWSKANFLKNFFLNPSLTNVDLTKNLILYYLLCSKYRFLQTITQI